MSCGLERGRDCRKARLSFLLLLNERFLFYKGMGNTVQNENPVKPTSKAIVKSPLSEQKAGGWTEVRKTELSS